MMAILFIPYYVMLTVILIQIYDENVASFCVFTAMNVSRK